MGIYHDSVERSFAEIPPMISKILTSEVVEGKVKTQEVLQNYISYIYDYDNNQQDALCRLIYYFKSALYVSDKVSPIIRST